MWLFSCGGAELCLLALGVLAGWWQEKVLAVTTVSVPWDVLAWAWCGDTEPGSRCWSKVFGVFVMELLCRCSLMGSRTWICQSQLSYVPGSHGLLHRACWVCVPWTGMARAAHPTSPKGAAAPLCPTQAAALLAVAMQELC